MSCLGFGVYLVNGDLSKYIQLFIPISWETFLCFSSCVVARRHLCHVALAAPWLKPLASSIGLLSPTRGSSLVPQHASPSFFKWPPPSAPRLLAAVRENYCAGRQITFSLARKTMTFECENHLRTRSQLRSDL